MATTTTVNVATRTGRTRDNSSATLQGVGGSTTTQGSTTATQPIGQIGQSVGDVSNTPSGSAIDSIPGASTSAVANTPVISLTNPAPTLYSSTTSTLSPVTRTSETVEASSPATTSASTDTRYTAGSLVGGIVGAALGAALVTFLATFFLCRHRNRRRSDLQSGREVDPVPQKSYKGGVAITEKSTSGSGYNDLDWQAYLPQSIDDALSRMLSRLCSTRSTCMSTITTTKPLCIQTRTSDWIFLGLNRTNYQRLWKPWFRTRS